MYRIGVIGDKESVLGFRAVGFDVHVADEFEEALTALQLLTSKNYAIIYVTEHIFEILSDEIDEYKDMPFPAVIVLPNNRGSSGVGMRNISKSVERAVGADIFKDKESGDR